jgi:hypothetical protein
MKKIILLLLIIVMLSGYGRVFAQDADPQITSFTTSATSVSRAALSDRTARMPVSWATENRPVVANLVFEQVLPDGSTVNVELPRLIPWVNSSGDGIAAPILPDGGQNNIKLQVRLINVLSGVEYDTRQIVIPIEDEGDGGGDVDNKPAILYFNTISPTIRREMIESGNARITVSWDTANRPLTSTLVFEQIMPDGSIVNVELPRENSWVNSAGDGVVAPRDPGGSAGSLRLRVRLVDLLYGRVYDQRSMVINILDLNEQPVEIVSFTTSAFEVDADQLAARTERVFVSWRVDNRPLNANLVFEQVLANGTVVNVELPRDFELVPSSGDGVVAPVPSGDGGFVRIQLRVIDRTSGHEYTKSEIAIPTSTDTGPMIADFDVLADNVERSELMTGAARLPVKWAVVRRPDNANLVFEQVYPNGTSQNVELPRTDPYVPTSGQGVVAPRDPGESVDTITIRIRLIDPGDGHTLASTQEIIPISDDVTGNTKIVDEAQCYMAPFQSSNAIARDTFARIETETRVQAEPMGNFVGTFAAGETVRIDEGPYCYYYVVWGSNNQRTFRKWKVSAVNGDLEGWVNEYTHDILGTTYHLEPLPQSAPDDGDGDQGSEVAILSFNSDADTVAAGGLVMFSWQVQNAQTVSLRLALSSSDATDVRIDDLPLSGSRTVPIPADLPQVTGTVYLYAFAESDAPAATSTLYLTVACNHAFFFGTAPDCKTSDAMTVDGAFQTFENGVMVWEGGTQHIFVLLDDGRAGWYLDTWQGQDLTYPEETPDGLIAPERGFGHLWTTTLEVRDAIGWATGPEQGYQMQYQEGTAQDGTDVRYFRLPDGRVVRYVSAGGGLMGTWNAVN